jgi:hypothetical protein
MANSKGFKRLVRARMERTGEGYMVAMHALQNGKPEPKRMSDSEVVAEYGEHLGVPVGEDTP